MRTLAHVRSASRITLPENNLAEGNAVHLEAGADRTTDLIIYKEPVSVSVGSDRWSTTKTNVNGPKRTSTPASRTVGTVILTPRTNVPFLLARSSIVARLPATMIRA